MYASKHYLDETQYLDFKIITEKIHQELKEIKDTLKNLNKIKKKEFKQNKHPSEENTSKTDKNGKENPGFMNEPKYAGTFSPLFLHMKKKIISQLFVFYSFFQ